MAFFYVSLIITCDLHQLICSMRLTLCIFVCLGLAILYMQRINMGFAVICMVNNTALRNTSDEFKFANSQSAFAFNKTIQADLEKCQFSQSFNNQSSFNTKDGPFNWDKKKQGMILSAFFYGYIISQVPGGWLALKIGGKLMASISLFLGSLTTILIPFAARTSFNLLIVCRFLTGLLHGPVFPSLGSMWSNWLPLSERSTLLGISFSGIQIGNILAMPIGGFLCIHGFDDGWASIFYIFGAVGLIWSILFFIFTTNTPKENRCISKQEVDYINETTKKSQSQVKLKTPWKSILTSRICLTLNLSCFCFNWGVYLYLTQIPSYIRDVLKFDVKSNGQMSAFPFVFCFVCVTLSSFLADFLIRKNILERLTLRKIFTGISMLVPMVALILLSFVTCSNPYIGVVLLTIGYGFTGFGSSGGLFVNFYEIGGPFTGVIIGIINTVGTLPGMIAPNVVGFITSNHKQEEWKIVFLLTAFIYFIGFLVYFLFADTNLQSWAKIDNNEQQKQQADENIDLITKQTSF